jgi:hypothetical protein
MCRETRRAEGCLADSLQGGCLHRCGGLLANRLLRSRAACHGVTIRSRPLATIVVRFGGRRCPVALLLMVVTRGKVLAEVTLIALARPLTGETEGTTYLGPAVPAGQELTDLVLDRTLSLDLPLGQCAKPFASAGPLELMLDLCGRHDWGDRTGVGRRSWRDWDQPGRSRCRPWSPVRHLANRRRIVDRRRSTCESSSTRRLGSTLAPHGRTPLQTVPAEVLCASRLREPRGHRAGTCRQAPQPRAQQARLDEAESASDRPCSNGFRGPRSRSGTCEPPAMSWPSGPRLLGYLGLTGGMAGRHLVPPGSPERRRGPVGTGRPVPAGISDTKVWSEMGVRS